MPLPGDTRRRSARVASIVSAAVIAFVSASKLSPEVVLSAGCVGELVVGGFVELETITVGPPAGMLGLGVVLICAEAIEHRCWLVFVIQLINQEE